MIYYYSTVNDIVMTHSKALEENLPLDFLRMKF